MNAHPIDFIPAFVLGALDPEEALQVGMHLSACAECKAEAEAFRTTVEALPYAAPPHDPPAHVKRQLLARIAASDADQPHMVLPQPRLRWARAAMAAALMLALVLGYLTIDARQQIRALNTEIATGQQAILDLRTQLAREQQATYFIAAPQTVPRRLDSPNRRANAMMYMQPNSAHAILVVSGLPRVAAGKIYQFWLAKPGVQVPSNTFDVDQNGTVTLAIDAPAPVNEYDQVMVTIEQGGGSTAPSSQVVLSGSLTSAAQSPPWV